MQVGSQVVLLVSTVSVVVQVGANAQGEKSTGAPPPCPLPAWVCWERLQVQGCLPALLTAAQPLPLLLPGASNENVIVLQELPLFSGNGKGALFPPPCLESRLSFEVVTVLLLVALCLLLVLDT